MCREVRGAKKHFTVSSSLPLLVLVFVVFVDFGFVVLWISWFRDFLVLCVNWMR